MVSPRVVPSELAEDWPYRLERQVGQGGTAQVWKAFDQKQGLPVALKVATLGIGGSPIADEADALIGLNSPNVPRLIGLGRVPPGIEQLPQDAPYVALSWMPGEPLESKTLGGSSRRHQLAFSVAIDVGEALWNLHDAGVAHGDIKPANILIDQRKDSTQACLVDLGFCTELDQRGLRGATPRYLAPEVARGIRSPRGQDLWAFGLVLAEIASEQVASAADVLRAIRETTLPPPFDSWCTALTAPDPGARPSAAWVAAVARSLRSAPQPESSEAWRVKASYLRVRREELSRAATAPSVHVQKGVASFYAEVVQLSRIAASLRNPSESKGDSLEITPLSAAERSRWLVALVGSAAASWQLQGAMLESSEAELAQALQRLASTMPPRAWSLREVIRALRPGDTQQEPGPSPWVDDIELALALARRPVSPLALEEAEQRAQRGDLGERLTLLLADALRGSGEMGRALACLGKRDEPEACALRAEILRRLGDKESAKQQALRVQGTQGEAVERARATLARQLLDAGEAQEALSLIAELPGARVCEVRALAHLALGDRDKSLQDVEQGMLLAIDDELRARLECVRGYLAHADGDAEAAHEYYARAVDHAARAGVVLEEATYRTGAASAAVWIGKIAEALEASLRASLLWEHLGQRAQWAYALLARAGAQGLAGAWLEARASAIAARDRAREARDERAELFSFMALFDALESGSDEARAAAQSAWKLARSAEDKVRAGARLLLSKGLSEEQIRELDVLVVGLGTAELADWWGARAWALREGAAPGRAPEILSQLTRLARQRAPLGSKGPALYQGRLLAEQQGDGETARVLALEQVRLVNTLVANAPPALRDSVLSVPWVRGGSGRVEPTVSSDQVRNLEALVRALARRDSLRTLLDQALDALVLWTGVERGLLLLRAPDDRLVVRSARNLERRRLESDQLKLSHSLALRALTTREPVVAVDAAGEISEVHASVHALGLRSVLAVPLLARGEALGVAYLDDRLRAGAFGPQELAWVKLIALVAAVAIADARDQLLLRRAARQAERAQRHLAETLAQREAELDRTSVELAKAREGRETRYRYDALVGHSEPLRAMLQLVDRVTPTSVPVLVVGESGSGKELVARALHNNGPRARGPFVSENCSAIPETLLESTLFGHVRGAFTSADRNRVGLFEAADGGSLFLDEIGEMSLAMQTKLLRVLQEGEVLPVGSSRSRKVDVRVIAATHREMATLVKEGRFREDLLYRLAVITIAVPSLRERRDDIELLFRHFLGRYAQGRKVRVSLEAATKLINHDWPGNVRQLENEIRRALVLCDDVIRLEHLSPEVTLRSAKGTRPSGLELRGRVDELEKQLVQEALGRTRGNQTQAAKLLGLSRYGLQKMIRRLEIEEH